MTSEAAFRNHLYPHVLPPDVDPDGEDVLVPLEDYDYGREWADLVEDVTGDRPEAVATDGGVVDVPQDPEPDPDPEQPDDETEAEAETETETDAEPDKNRFQCPYTGCGVDVEGRPDQCPECERPFYW